MKIVLIENVSYAEKTSRQTEHDKYMDRRL
jgi:hypothetical protein